MQLFEQPKKKEKQRKVDTSQSNEILTLVRRIRELEERVENQRSKDKIIERNMLDHFKKFKADISTINSDISEIKNEINKTNAESSKIIKELKLSASKEDVKILQKYVDLWNPIRFVTNEQVKRLIDDALEEKEKQNI